MMKKSIFTIALLMLIGQIWAQQDETLFSKTHRGGFFVSTMIEYSDFDSDVTSAVGGGAAFVAGDVFFGGYGMGTVSYADLFDGNITKLNMGHGGFWFGIVPFRHKAFHPFASAKIGWGGLNVEFNDGAFDVEHNIFLLSPEVGFEVNFFRWLRISAGAGYRFVNGLDNTMNIRNDDISGPTGTLTFKIGGFGRRNVNN
ncbi:MAG: hypothetical protein NXI23_10610 [Bacteroidetes bacterium]|nr:hypothetical protein [Bacteroidota bacterium]